MKNQKINDGWAKFLKSFIPAAQLAELVEYGEMEEEFFLKDFTIYCHAADCLINAAAWENYYNDTLSFF
jgi:hypothetical protein